jgi:hypothetical protein
VLQDVLDLAGGDLGVVLGHADGDVAEVAADVVQPGAVGQQPGGQGVTGLMGDAANTQVELVYPLAEPALESVVADRPGAVQVTDGRGEQGQPGAFSGARRAAVMVLEPVQRLALPFGGPLVDVFRDADRLVVVADLCLVVPQQRQPAIPACAVQPQADDLAAPAPGRDDRFPDVTDAAIGRIEGAGEPGQVARVSQGTGGLVGERAAGPLGHRAAMRQRDDESAVQPDPVGITGVERVPQDLARVVQDHAPGTAADERGLAVGAGQAEGPQAGALVLVYGLPLSKIAYFTRDDITRHDGQSWLRHHGRQILLPPRLAALTSRLALQPAPDTILTRLAGPPSWLFPGNDPTRPASHAHLRTGLRRHGITTHTARNTAVGALAAELPASVLAGITGLHISTATRWTRSTRRDWTEYVAARTPHQNEMAGDEGLLQYTRHPPRLHGTTQAAATRCARRLRGLPGDNSRAWETCCHGE